MGSLRRICATVPRRGPLPKLLWADLLLLLLLLLLTDHVSYYMISHILKNRKFSIILRCLFTSFWIFFDSSVSTAFFSHFQYFQLYLCDELKLQPISFLSEIQKHVEITYVIVNSSSLTSSVDSHYSKFLIRLGARR